MRIRCEDSDDRCEACGGHDDVEGGLCADCFRSMPVDAGFMSAARVAECRGGVS
jgi:hypothetical protein